MTDFVLFVLYGTEYVLILHFVYHIYTSKTSRSNVCVCNRRYSWLHMELKSYYISLAIENVDLKNYPFKYLLFFQSIIV